MPCLMEMLRCMLVLRFIATADMAAAQAQPQMHPGVACLETLLAAARAGRHVADLIEMRTLFSHGIALLELALGSRAAAHQNKIRIALALGLRRLPRKPG